MNGEKLWERSPIPGAMNKIAVLDTGYKSYEYEYLLFTQHGYELVIYKGQAGDNQLKFEFAREAVGILVRGTGVSAKELAQMPHLKAIVRYGVGFDNIKLEDAKKKEIRVANVQGYANHAVSDHALALIFSCMRDLTAAPGKTFGEPTRKNIFEMHNKTLGIIGIGRIGGQLSLKATSLFKRTLAYDPYKSEGQISALKAQKVGLSELLRECHVISLHCNLTKETLHMLNKSRFGEMKLKPIIINTARGPVIDERAMLSALDKGLIHSAGLDVFEKEPPGSAQTELLDHPHVLSTPHIAWYSDHAMQILQKRAAENMIGLLTGNIVDDEL